MKKILYIVLSVLFIIFLTSCDPGSTSLEYHFEKEEVKTVELIHYDNHNQHHFRFWAPNHFSDLKNLDLEYIAVIKTLNEELLSSFLDELLEYPLLDTYYAYDSPSGICIRLTMNNNDFVIVHCMNNRFNGYIGKYDSEGKVLDFYGCFESYSSFSNLLNYFSEDDK